jgi:hypothetical protein
MQPSTDHKYIGVYFPYDNNTPGSFYQIKSKAPYTKLNCDART